MDTIVELAVLMVGTIGMAIPFGLYIARMISYEMRPLERTLAKVESGFYKLVAINATKQMTWKQYFFALFVTDIAVAVFMILVLTLQNYLPSHENFKGLSLDLAFNTAMSFVTDTNLQHYAGDQQLSNLSQMIAITFTQFVAPASGIVAAFALIRAFIRKNFGLGNFFVDFIRVTVTLLLPVAVISSLVLMVIGVPQTLSTTVTAHTLEGNKQDIRVGPVASLLAIKQLGSNGGGFYVANSAHPFENPTGLSNLYETFLMLVIPLSLPIAFAKLIGKWRGVSILIAIIISFGSLLILAFSVTSGPSLLETRFGNVGSTIFNTVSITTNTGAVNSSLLGMAPNAIISFFLGMFIQAIPGAVGTGMMTMVMYVVITLFVVGLMVGKTPEFLSMKISPRDVKLAVFVFLSHPAIILIPTVIAFATGNTQAIMGATGGIGHHITPMGFTQTLYEYTSAAANNGSDYFGTSANTPFWNISTAIVILLGRFIPIALILAIAGSFTMKDRREVIEPIKTQGPIFITVLIVITFLLTALTFFPFIVIGPFSL
ncbi:MAG TPA: potassium-transporting ATPase subunit KdpA [Nitrososphaeraceae archaeon]